MGTINDCKRCACPLSDEENNFSPTCQLKDMAYDNQNEVTNDYGLMPYQNFEYLCTRCPEGYIGDHCEWYATTNRFRTNRFIDIPILF